MKEELNKQNPLVDNKSTLFLRIAVVGLGLVALLFATIILSEIYNDFDNAFPTISHLKYPIIGILGLALVPYFIALYQSMRLLNFIDTNKAFSVLAVKSLRKIKYCGVVMSSLFIILMPFVYMVAQADDAPGLIIIGGVIAGAPMAIAVFAAVLEKLLQSAIEIKEENELTV